MLSVSTVYHYINIPDIHNTIFNLANTFSYLKKKIVSSAKKQILIVNKCVNKSIIIY